MEIAILTLCVLIVLGLVSIIDNQRKITRNQEKIVKYILATRK
jgi:UDP-N-acetylmuramyl pentapeptide phosphotransferase/UDP-N-acetylglucosamine-1-phosphate transferase